MTNKNISRLLAGAGLLAMMTACSSDEPVNVNGGMTSEGGRNAYMTVNLKDVGAMATHGKPHRVPGETAGDGTFEDGTIDVECDINNARFFFFDENGVFVSEASVWDGGNIKDPADDNISYEGNTVIVLKNLSDNVAPKYMLTVLNGAGFNASSTLKATAEALELGWKNDGRFAMTTTSYRGEMTNHPDNDKEIHYYANVIEPGNFMEGNPGEDVDLSAIQGLEPVIVYVERLAAKVQLDLSSLSNETATTEDGRTLYKLDATVAGKPNDVGDQIGDTDLYLDILGWDLNGTSRQSYFSKQLDRANWTATGSTPWENWNVAQFHRSYWGMSPTYGQAYDTNTIEFEVFAKKDENNKIIYVNPNHTVASTDKYDMSGFRYCNERTNTPGVIYRNGKVIPSSLTSVILKARICDVNGNPLDLVRSTNGVLYLRDQYLQYILNNANVQNNLNVWYVIAETGESYVNEKGETVIATKTEYRQVGKEMVTLKASSLGTGMVVVAPNLDLSKTYYSRTTKADGTYEWSAYAKTVDGTGAVTENAATAALKTSLDIPLNNGKAEAFTGGASYYNIPIEHETSVGTGNLGYYGVVRNHWYKLTVNQILKVGHGVFKPGEGEDEGETIIPNEPENPAYYLTAKLRVLSWKRVNQSVDL